MVVWCNMKLWYSIQHEGEFCLLGGNSLPVLLKSAVASEEHTEKAASRASFMLISCLSCSWTWRWTLYDPLKCWMTFTRLHAIISQKVELFVVTSYPEVCTFWTHTKEINISGGEVLDAVAWLWSEGHGEEADKRKHICLWIYAGCPDERYPK
jgi:hypothetical protein